MSCEKSSEGIDWTTEYKKLDDKYMGIKNDKYDAEFYMMGFKGCKSKIETMFREEINGIDSKNIHSSLTLNLKRLYKRIFGEEYVPTTEFKGEKHGR